MLTANNGCAGLPNFADRHHRVLTQLSTNPAPPADSLYQLIIAALRFDALPIDYDHKRWSIDFLKTWPPGTAAHSNYHERLQHGTWLTVKRAARGSCRSTVVRPGP